MIRQRLRHYLGLPVCHLASTVYIAVYLSMSTILGNVSQAVKQRQFK
jgi:hypothetical protein